MRWKKLIYNGKKYDFVEVSETGDIRTINRIITYADGHIRKVYGKLLSKRTNNKEKHFFTEISYNNKSKTIYIHKAVFESFYPRKIKQYVSHKDGNVQNNNLTNLYTVTHSELQIRNMYNNPKSRWRLSERNKKNGYYTNLKISKKQTITKNKYYIEKVFILLEKGFNKNNIKDILHISSTSVTRIIKENS